MTTAITGRDGIVDGRRIIMGTVTCDHVSLSLHTHDQPPHSPTAPKSLMFRYIWKLLFPNATVPWRRMSANQ